MEGGRGEGRMGGRRVPPSPFELFPFCPSVNSMPSPRSSFALLYFRRGVRCFYFLFIKKKKIISFLERALALSCAGLHRVRFTHFCSRPLDFLTLITSSFFLQSMFWLFFLERMKIAEFDHLLFFCCWMHKSINRTATKYDKLLTCSSWQ